MILAKTQPLMKWVPGAHSPEVQRPVCKADHTMPPSVQVKSMWSYTTPPPYTFMAWCLMKRRDNVRHHF